ncbi:hypothetical protein DYB32_004841 [Aphanomyces invadans]|uniref:CFA20 domain-containing protein n=1 Tax=Aphanomyces invadans TaxID=157072 RepID=A0A418AWC4_9STRA|nr:hypothetical protein DYB32_004841 [Aphanomyces invadans]
MKPPCCSNRDDRFGTADMFQGGDSVELLAAGGKNPAAPWKLTGKVRREYDKLSKVFLFTMEGSALATKMALPKDSTKSLTRDTWLNWCFDVAALVDGSFAKTLRTLDSISLSGTCKLRVFTMKEPPIPSDHPFDFVGGVDIPRAFAIPRAITEYFAAKTVAPPPSASLPTHLPDDKSPVKPPTHTEAPRLSRPTTAIASDAVERVVDAVPTSRSNAELTAKELAKALALDESPFFRDDLPSPVAVRMTSSIHRGSFTQESILQVPAAMEWMDEEDSRGVSNEDSAPPSILDGRPDNQTPDSIPEPTSTTPEVKNQRIDVGAAKSVASLFQWAPQSLLQPVGQPQLTAALDPPFAPCMEDEEGPLTSNGIAKVAHHSEPQDDTEQVRVKEEVSHPLGTKGRWMDQVGRLFVAVMALIASTRTTARTTTTN